MISWVNATAVVVLLPFLTCFPPMMKSEAMEMSTVARRPMAMVTSMRLKPRSFAADLRSSATFRDEAVRMVFLRPLGRHLTVGTGHPTHRVEIQRPPVGPGRVHRVLQRDGRRAGGDRPVGSEGDGRRTGGDEPNGHRKRHAPHPSLRVGPAVASARRVHRETRREPRG